MCVGTPGRAPATVVDTGGRAFEEHGARGGWEAEAQAGEEPRGGQREPSRALAGQVKVSPWSQSHQRRV